MTKPSIAFYAPMKPPDHPKPSGDRQIARLTMRALERAGADVTLASRLRTLDMAGDEDFQVDANERAVAQYARIIAGPKPDLWFTYHCYYKAPDLLGDAVARALDIPYVVSEPSIAPKRADGPWAAFAKASVAAIAQADLLFWTTARDRPALEAAGHATKMRHLPAFVDPGGAMPPRSADAPLRLLTVAMMRPGDKTESYRRLALALSHLDLAWHLTVIGDGAARPKIVPLFAGQPVTWLGAIDDPAEIRRAYEEADLLVWPGIGEGVGMIYLEAQAAGLPVIAEDHPAQRDVVATPLAPPEDPAAFARLIADSAARRPDLSAAARAKIDAQHSLDAAASRLRASLWPLMGRTP